MQHMQHHIAQDPLQTFERLHAICFCGFFLFFNQTYSIAVCISLADDFLTTFGWETKRKFIAATRWSVSGGRKMHTSYRMYLCNNLLSITN